MKLLGSNLGAYNAGERAPLTVSCEEMVDPLQSPDTDRAGPKVIGRRTSEAVSVEQALALQETVAALLPPLSGVRGASSLRMANWYADRIHRRPGYWREQ